MIIFCLKIVLDCNSFIYKLDRLSDARLMKIIVKTPTCKWACTTIFKQLLHSRTLSSFQHAHISLKWSYKNYY